MRFELSGEVVSKKNSRIVNTKTGRTFPSKHFTEWHLSASVQIMRQKMNYTGFPIASCRVKLIFIHGDKRRRDSDNGTSSIFDLLVDCGVFKDDNWQVISRYEVENLYDKNNPSCIVEIL